MTNLGRIDRVLSWFERGPFNIYSGLCSQNRDKNVQCRRCVEVCPTQALILGESIRVNLQRCNLCGICTNVCPNGVFELKDPSDQTLLTQTRECLDASREVCFACHKFQSSLDDENSRPILRLFCLGRINEAVLVGSAALGASVVALHTGSCDECEISLGRRVIEETVRIARQTLNIFGSRSEIFLTPQAPEEIYSGRGAKNVTLPHNTGGYSRRDFVSEVRRRALDFGLALIEERMPTVAKEPKEGRLEYRLPTKRALFLGMIGKLGTPTTESAKVGELPFHNISIGEGCSLCECCALFCPTKALAVRKDNHQGKINFNLARCTKCGLCTLECPDSALVFSEHFNPEMLLSQESKTLRTFALLVCRECGRQFASPTRKDLCRFCEKRKNLLS